MRITFSNITSWNTRKDPVLSDGAWLSLFAETRLQATAIPRAMAVARNHGYNASFVPALPHVGGVGALIHKDYDLQQIWSDGKGRAAVMLTWTGSHTLAIGVLYGHANRADQHQTEELAAAIVTQMRPFAGVPCLLAGDFNLVPTELPAIAELIGLGWGQLHDPSIPTCYVDGCEPSSIDAMFGNTHFQARASSMIIHEDLVFHPHRRLSVQYEMGDLSFPQIAVPPTFQVSVTAKRRLTNVTWHDVHFRGHLDDDYASWATAAMGELVGPGEHSVFRHRQQTPGIIDKTVSPSTAGYLLHVRKAAQTRSSEQELQHRLHELLLAITRGHAAKQRSHLAALQRNPLAGQLHLDMQILSGAALAGTLHDHQ
eukprot:4455049-Amphidinium_carterae.1